MKRFIIPILLIALLLLVGCDQDMRNGLAGFLGTFGGNAFLDSGMIPSDHSNAEATVEHIASLGENSHNVVATDGEITGDLFGLGDDSELDLGDLSEIESLLLPQGSDEQKELKNNLEDALGSDSEKQALLDELSKPAIGDAQKAAEGTVALLDALLEALIGDDDEFGFLKDLLPDLDEEGDELTQGDVLMLQLMTDLVGNAVELIGEVKEGGGDVAPKDVIPLVDEVIFAAWVAGQVGGTTSLGFSGFGGLSDFVTKMMSEGEGEH